jgi:RNA polymerase sigma factor (sigma-70 family)
MQVGLSDDSVLLERWCDERCERAFAELVGKYERLVVGGVLRRTGDLELARDVAQQVFAILARKGRLLLGRANISGWLYQAAMHIAARLQLSDGRRRARHTMAEPAAAARDEHWPALEEALGKLSNADREALLLHYFQDLSYVEMATALRVSEPAARKRVSRALQKLGALLREKGLGAPASLLAAAAIQTSFAAKTSLAAGALAATATLPTPPIVLANALMSHLTTKVAIFATALAIVPLVSEWNTHANLRAEVAQLPAAAALASTNSAVEPIGATADLSEVQAQLAAAREARKAADERVAELSSFAKRAEGELVFSLGTVDAMAQKLGSTLKLMGIARAQKAINLDEDSPEWKEHETRMRQVVDEMPELFSTLRELPRLERDPAKAARFYAMLIGESAGLDEPTRARLVSPLQTWVKELQADGLAFPQRPKENTAQWDQRRLAAMVKVSAELKRFMPAQNASPQGPLLSAFLLKGNERQVGEIFDVAFGKLP